MDVGFSIKRRNPDTGQWADLPAVELAGKSLEQAMRALAGQEVVAEFRFEDRRCFFCGTSHWQDRMGRKGSAILFEQALERLASCCPGLLRETIPVPETVASIFDAATVSSMTMNAGNDPSPLFDADKGA